MKNIKKSIDILKIPKGSYCYTYVDNKYVYCPFHKTIDDNGVKLPFCTFLNKGGIDNSTTDEDFKILEKKYGSEDEVWKKYPLDLLWDSVKECGENNDINEEELI
jgi:hypothetical protein